MIYQNTDSKDLYYLDDRLAYQFEKLASRIQPSKGYNITLEDVFDELGIDMDGEQRKMYRLFGWNT